LILHTGVIENTCSGSEEVVCPDSPTEFQKV